MQAQTTHMKGELIAEVNGKTTGTTIKELTPLGVRIEINDQSQITGKFNGNSMETVTVFQKIDGTNDWETKGICVTKEGDFIVIAGRGTGRNTSPTAGKWDGDVTFMTQSPKLAWLNTTKGWVEGSGDQAAGTFHGKVYAKK